MLPENSLTEIKEERLPVMEQFYTLQGEGVHSGKAAYFIRLGGCDVGCVWCDVKDSWDASKHPVKKVEEIVNEALKFPGKICVVTGGEPLMYNLDQLTTELHEAGFKTHIETSGAYNMSGNWDWICVSPKKFKAPLEENLKLANELKVVIFNKSDFDWAQKNAAMANKNCELILQPEWSKASEMMPLMIDFVKSNPQWRVSLQTHKFMQIP